MRDNGKLWDPIIRTQWDTRPQNTIQKTPSKTGTHVGRQGETRPRQTDTWETMGGNGRQDLGKAGTPPNTGTHVGRQGETKAREAGPSIQQSEIRRETRRQGEPRPREGWRNINAGRQCNARQGHTIQHRHTGLAPYKGVERKGYLQSQMGQKYVKWGVCSNRLSK